MLSSWPEAMIPRGARPPSVRSSTRGGSLTSSSSPVYIGGG